MLCAANFVEVAVPTCGRVVGCDVVVPEAHERVRQRVVVAKSAVPPGSSTTVTVRRREIVVLNDGGTYHAMFNRCPHHQARLSGGRVAGTNGPTPVGEFSFSSDRRVLRCPWHHYEFELDSGRCPADPGRFRVAVYEIEDHGDEIVVLV